MYTTTFRQPGRADKQRVVHKSADALYALICALEGACSARWLASDKAEITYSNGYVETLTNVSTRRYRRP